MNSWKMMPRPKQGGSLDSQPPFGRSARSIDRLVEKVTGVKVVSPRPGAVYRRKVRFLRQPRRCLIEFAGGVPSYWH
jgi:hypothetical protein